MCVGVWFRQHLILHFSINSSNDKQFSVNRTLFLLSQDMENIYWCDQVKKTKDRKVVEDGDWTTKRKIYGWMNYAYIYIYIYSALLCIAVHLKRFTIMCVCVCGGGSLLNHHQCAASTWMMRRLPQDNGTSALTTHQLQVERRESHKVQREEGPHEEKERIEKMLFSSWHGMAHLLIIMFNECHYK